MGVLLISAGLIGLAAGASGLTQPPSAEVPARPGDFVLPYGGTKLLATAIDPLPVIPSELTDSASAQAIADYDAARFDQPGGFAAMFNDAAVSLQVRQGDQGALTAFLTDLVSNQSVFDPPQQNPDSARQTQMATLTPLKSDPKNGGRLVLVAISLFDFGVATQKAGSPSGPAAAPLLKERALSLLDVGSATFPAERTLALDYAYFQSSVPSACTPSLVSVFRGIAPLARWLSSHPDDVTARLLLSNLQSRTAYSPSEFDRALATLQPLMAKPATAPLAHAARGDAEMSIASRRQGDAPYLAHTEAEAALADYRQALVSADDPGLYAGIASALDALGDHVDAIQAQERAIRIAPSSTSLALGLAAMEWHNANFAAARSAARSAFTLSLAPSNPAAGRTRLVPGAAAHPVPGDRSFLGWSVGSDSRSLGVATTGSGCGGGYLVASELVPAVPDHGNLDAWLSEPAMTAAVTTAIESSIALGDAQAAAQDENAWKQAAGSSADSTQTTTFDSDVAAAALAAGRPAPNSINWDALFEASSVLRHAGAVEAATDPAKARDYFLRAAKVCRAGESAKPTSADDYETAQLATSAVVCDGESSFHAGDLSAAITAFKTAQKRQQGLGYGEPATLELAQAMLASGDRAGAMRLFVEGTTEAWQNGGGGAVYATAGLEQLGTIALDGGQSAAAVAYFDLAIAGLTNFNAQPVDFVDYIDPEGELVGQRAHLNRGVALLREIQSSPDSAPDCTRAPAVCAEARNDFEAALASDPGNPIFLLDLGWVDRASGNTASARHELSLAVTGDLAFNALNDLGVLQARAGDWGSARGSFERALALKPDYDLAAWNLGVLWLQRGIVGMPKGEAYLSRAIGENRSLARSDIDFKTDDRTYRVVFGAGPKPGQGSTNGAVTAIALAQVATISAPLAANPLQIFGGWLEANLPGVIGPVQRRVRSLLAGPARHAWLVTLPFTALVTTALAWPASAVALSTVSVAVGATLFAVLVHESAQAVVASVERVRIKPAMWATGIAAALVLLPFRLSIGPFVGHDVDPGSAADRAWRAVLAGPVANLAVGAGAFVLYRVVPVPAFQVVAQAQLVMLGFSLLPFKPLDGYVLARRHRWVVMGLGLVVLMLGALVTLGRV